MNNTNVIKLSSFKISINIKGDADSKKVVIVIPGRCDSKDYVHMKSHVEYLSKMGYLALSFDPPGTWESPGGIGLCTTTNYIKAIHELIAHFGNKTTLLVGHSRGGAAAILAGANNPYVDGIILIMCSYGNPSPPSEEAINIGFQLTSRDSPPGDKKHTSQKKFELPLSYFEDAAKYDIVSSLKRIKCKKLMIYGSKDKFTDIDDVKRIFSEIPGPKRLVELDSEHDYRYDKSAITRVNREIGKFLKE